MDKWWDLAAERIAKMDRHDRLSLIELLRCPINDQEDYDATVKTLAEILENRPVRVFPMPLTRKSNV